MPAGTLRFTVGADIEIDLAKWVTVHGGDDTINDIRDSVSQFMVDTLNAWLLNEGTGHANR